MKSRFISRLNDEISVTSDKHRKKCLLAERAAYLARLGDIEEARKQLALIQRENSFEPQVRVSILLNIADGLCHYYEDMAPEARDRYQRARALSIASSQADLQAKAASWLALLEYGEHRFDQMFSYLDEATEKADPADNQTTSRICLLLAQTLHLANKFDLAMKWYQRSRILAVINLDEAVISALMHNMSSIWTVNRRNSDLGGIETNDESRVAWISAKSTWNFDQMVGSTGLNALTPLMQAQICSLEGRYAEALSIYQSALQTLVLKALGGWRSWLVADMGWCNAKLGNFAQASTDFASALESMSVHHHLDDQAATFSRLSEGMNVLGDPTRASAYFLAAKGAWKSFAVLQTDMSSQSMDFIGRKAKLLLEQT